MARGRKWEMTADKFLTLDEVRRLRQAVEAKAALDLAKGRTLWVKRWMLVDLALSSGLRVSEMVNLRCGDLRLGGKAHLVVRNGKGGKPGAVYLDTAFVRHLREYLTRKERVGEPLGVDDYLLCKLSGQPYTRDALHKTFKLCLEAAGIPRERYSIHSARHTYCTYLYAATKDLRLVQKQARHSSPAVTAVYADVEPERMSEGVEAMRGMVGGGRR
ncbi:MAG: site-specific integrase [Candidatus Tectomicrobia bacterium]|nr:site-specific integrase [Candidatus Tectomicrobia bacterium]